MSIPRNFCFFPIDTVRLPKFPAIVSVTFLITPSSMCDTLLPSKYHTIVHCLSLMVLFTMHLPYGLIRNLYYFRVFEYISYHGISDSMHTYKAFIRRRYSTFTPFSSHIFFLCLGFTLHTMSTNSPSIFNRINLSYGMLELRYAPGTSKITKYLSSCASMMRLVNKANR